MMSESIITAQKIAINAAQKKIGLLAFAGKTAYGFRLLSLSMETEMENGNH
jgi:hypothetical protein